MTFDILSAALTILFQDVELSVQVLEVGRLLSPVIHSDVALLSHVNILNLSFRVKRN